MEAGSGRRQHLSVVSNNLFIQMQKLKIDLFCGASIVSYLY